MAKPVVLTDATFEEMVEKRKGVMLVDFWAEWCGPCRQIAPAPEEIGTEMDGKVTVAKINIDESPDTPSKYGVRGIPTLMLFKNGELIASKTGAQPKSKIVEWINENA